MKKGKQVLAGCGFFILIFVSTVLTFALLSTGGNAADANSVISLTIEQEQLLSKLNATGDISLEPNLNRLHIKDYFWNSLNYQQKEFVTKTATVKMCNEKKSTAYWYK